MKYRVEYAKAARADLREIGLYLKQAAGERIAEAITRDIMNAVDTLANKPHRQRTRDVLLPCPDCARFPQEAI